MIEDQSILKSLILKIVLKMHQKISICRQFFFQKLKWSFQILLIVPTNSFIINEYFFCHKTVLFLCSKTNILFLSENWLFIAFNKHNRKYSRRNIFEAFFLSFYPVKNVSRSLKVSIRKDILGYLHVKDIRQN